MCFSYQRVPVDAGGDGWIISVAGVDSVESSEKWFPRKAFFIQNPLKSNYGALNWKILKRLILPKFFP